jgi:predicted porin
MNMKKSLIALAVAGAFAAPAFAATSNVDVYGIMNIAIQDTDQSGVDASIEDNVSRIGFKGSEDLGGGLKAIWQIESGINVTTGSTTLASRNSFVGLAGGFGTVLAGRHDTPYKLGTVKLDIFGDTIADYNSGANNGGLDNVDLIDKTHDHRNGQALAYISPTFSGFHVGAAVVMADEAANANNGKTIDATSITAIYENGPLFLSLSHQDVKALKSKALKFGAGYAFGDTKVGFVYEDLNNATSTGHVSGANDRDSWLVNVAHAMGPITLKAQYGQVDEGASVDQDLWAIGADYNLSKRTAVYFVYGNGDDDAGSDAAGWNLGVKHSF